MSWNGSLAIFSKNRVLTCVVILINKTGGSFQIDPTVVCSFKFMFSGNCSYIEKNDGYPLQIDPNVVGPFILCSLNLHRARYV